VWGLAATLFECLTGAAPGRAPELAHVPAPLRTLLGACLQPDPVRRPGLEELRDRLDDLLVEPQRRFRWTRWPRR
jgi:hypothetical protein